LPRAPTIGDAERVAAVLSHPGTTVFGCDADWRAMSMTTVHVLPNVTIDGQPNPRIDNVVTPAPWRRSRVRAVPQANVAAAWQTDVYTVMLPMRRLRGAKVFSEALASAPRTNGA
jgi:hypothetical protein